MVKFKGFRPATIWRGAAFHFLAVFSKKKTIWQILIVIFENVSPKGISWLKMKYFEISVSTANSRYLQTAAIKTTVCQNGGASLLLIDKNVWPTEKQQSWAHFYCWRLLAISERRHIYFRSYPNGHKWNKFLHLVANRQMHFVLTFGRTSGGRGRSCLLRSLRGPFF